MINSDYLSLSIIAGNYKVPSNNVVLQRCAIVSSVQQSVPAAELVFGDGAGFFQHIVTPEDGLPVEISIGNGSTSPVSLKFRVFKPKNNVASVGNQVSLILYWDSPIYMGGTTNTAINDTSSNVISSIAKNFNFTPDVDQTQDLQAWIPGNVRWCQFAASVAKAGWASNTSAFLLGVSLDNKMRYKNVGSYQYDSSLPILRLGAVESDGTFIPVTSWTQTSVSGFNNMRGAYHGAQQNQGYTLNGGMGENNVNVSKTKGTQFLSINQDVKQSLSNARLHSWSTIDCGNTHQNYQTALYQNKRLLQTNSMNLSVLTMVQTGLDIMDKVQVEAFLPSARGEKSSIYSDYSGYYFIKSKTVYAGPNAIYMERLNLVRDGSNVDLQKGLL